MSSIDWCMPTYTHVYEHPKQVRLISPSVIMTYANDNVAYLLILPAACCAGIALYLFSHSGAAAEWHPCTHYTHIDTYTYTDPRLKPPQHTLPLRPMPA